MKLLDADNLYAERVYFAYGRVPGFLDAVKEGLQHAIQMMPESASGERELPEGFHVLVVEQLGCEVRLWRASTIAACAFGKLAWEHVVVKRDPGVQPDTDLREETSMTDPQQSRLYISLPQAQLELAQAMREAGIPANSKTARCMFEATKNGRGESLCKLGRSPLWGNEIRVREGKALRSEFMDVLGQLVASGHNFQKAGRSSWGN